LTFQTYLSVNIKMIMCQERQIKLNKI